MACCGQRRAALKGTGSRMRLGTLGAAAPSRPPEASQDEVRLRYLADAAIRVRGANTRRIYDFSSADPVQQIDARDAGGLMRTGLFRTA
jgi:hypothetical protein